MMKPNDLFYSNLVHKQRQSTTSPFLVGIEWNPGPKTKATRKVAKPSAPKAKSRKHLSAFQKGQIEMGLGLGISFGKLGKTVGCKDGTVSRYARKLKAGESLDNKTSPGRPRRLTQGSNETLFELHPPTDD